MSDSLQKLFSAENLARFERAAPLHDDATIKSEISTEAAKRQKKKALVEKEKKFTPEELEHQQFLVLKQKKMEEKKAKRKIKPRKSENESESPEKVATKEAKVKDNDDSDSGDGDNDDKPIEEGDSKTSRLDGARTLFVGNVPIHHTTKSLTKLFSKFGDIESIRIRSIPVAGLAVDDAGNQTLVRKVTAFKKDYGQQKMSFNAYIVFKDAAAPVKALVMNNTVLEGGEKGAKNRHIRVDHMQATPFDPKCTVFVGALPHYCDEEDLREHFAKKLPNKQKDIANIRLIRDQDTMIGKGIGYVQFVDSTCVMRAIGLHQQPYKKRWKLRITTCGKRTKRLEHNSSVGTVVSSKSVDTKSSARNNGKSDDKGSRGRVTSGRDGRDSRGRDSSKGRERDGTTGHKRKSMNGGDSASDSKDSNGDKKKKPRWRDLTGDQIEARKQASVAAHSAAVKRIEKARSKMSTKNTRMKVLKERGQVKEKGRKGKRLGGAVKKAMKAQKGT